MVAVDASGDGIADCWEEWILRGKGRRGACTNNAGTNKNSGMRVKVGDGENIEHCSVLVSTRRASESMNALFRPSQHGITCSLKRGTTRRGTRVVMGATGAVSSPSGWRRTVWVGCRAAVRRVGASPAPRGCLKLKERQRMSEAHCAGGGA